MSSVTAAKALTPAQIAAAMREAGWDDAAIPIGVAVALAESGGNPRAVNNKNRNGSSDYGLFQINSIHANLLTTGDRFNPVDNARMALTVYRQAGSSWKPWAAYNSGAHTKFISASDLAKPAIAGAVAANTAGKILAPDSPFNLLSNAWNTLMSPELWRRIGWILLQYF